ncbi:hypothetical protein I7X12_05735 [Halosimplex litoreum]|uniref:Uncharacterized protein n=1 Tax=Halosimplex litoreum TaxID=1198301 RepID=A0A7T3KWN9_9EURY|nr:hypothetical protein [Halosimplex litoreum]QPV64125.1 hypothetical protein I7X12_05735 [Halosimplex litoreum]
MSVVRRPARESVLIALAPGVVAVLGLAVNLVSFAVAAAGLAVVGFGTDRASRSLVTAGSGLIFAGVLNAGARGAPPAVLLLVTAATVVTWTTAEQVVGLADHLGRDAPVQRAILVHLGGATLTTLVAGGIALGVFLFSTATLTPGVLVFLLVGSALLLYALEP